MSSDSSFFFCNFASVMIAKKQIIYDSDFGQVFIVTRRTVRNVTMRLKEDGLHVTTPPYRSVKALLEVIAPFRERLLKLKSDVSPKPFGWDYTLEGECFRLWLEPSKLKHFTIRPMEEGVKICCPEETDFSDKRVQMLVRNAVARALKKKAEEYKKYLEEIGKELSESQIALMEEGRAKERAEIEAAYREKMEKITGQTKDEIALRKNLEELKEKELEEVDRKWEEKRAEAELSAMKTRLSAMGASTQEELNQRLRMELEVNELMRQAEVRAAEQKGEDVIAIEEKYMKMRNDIIVKNLGQRVKLIEQSTDEELRAQEVAALQEMNALKQQYASGEIDREAYEKGQYDVAAKYSKMRLEALMKEAEMQLSIGGLTEAQQKELGDRLDNLKAQLESIGLDEEVDKNKEKLDEFNEAVMQMEGVANDALGGTGKLFEGLGSLIRDFADDGKLSMDNIVQSIGSVMAGLSSLMGDIYDAKLEKLEEEQEANEEAYDAEIERIEKLEEQGAISTEEAEARKRAAEDRTKQKEEEIDTLKKGPSDKDDEIVTLKKELEAKNEEIASIKKDLQSKNDEVASLRKDLESKDAELRTLRKELAAKDDEIDSLRNGPAAKDDEIATLKKDLKDKAAEIDSLKKEIKAKSDNVHKLNQDLSAKEKEIARLENELLEKENSARASGDEMERDLNNLRKEFNATQAENKKLKKEISALENRIHTLEESASSDKPQDDKSQMLIARMGSREAIELANNAIARAKARGAHHKLTLIFAGMMWLWILFGHDADVFPFNSQ